MTKHKCVLFFVIVCKNTKEIIKLDFKKYLAFRKNI